MCPMIRAGISVMGLCISSRYPQTCMSSGKGYKALECVAQRMCPLIRAGISAMGDMTHPCSRHHWLCTSFDVRLSLSAPLMCNTTSSYVWHDSSMCVTWPIHMCDTTHSYVWHDSSMCVTWLIHTDAACDTSKGVVGHVWHDSSKCGMTHSYAWHGSFVCVTRLIRMRDMTHPCVCRDSFIQMQHVTPSKVSLDMCVTRLIHMWHDAFICVT